LLNGTSAHIRLFSARKWHEICDKRENIIINQGYLAMIKYEKPITSLFVKVKVKSDLI